MKKIYIIAVLTIMLSFSSCMPSNSDHDSIISSSNPNVESSSSSPVGSDTGSSNNVTSSENNNSKPQTVNKSSKILPNLTLYLEKEPSVSGKYQGGKRVQYKNLDATYINRATDELLSLLMDPKYQLKLKEKRITGNDGLDERYEFEYTGSASVSEISGKNDDYPFNVELAIYKSKKGETFSVQLHWAPEFEIVDSKRHISVKLHDGSSGSAGGSGKIADGEVDIPEFAKLDCLTCKGDGDCTRCGGDGYTGFGDAKAGCNKCHGNGKCTSCGGTGKR